ncbi:hypothetical protein NFI95_04100 [Acetobacteraceae bacterium KSS8]|uniref:Uncharacterized protein n=1 Tax=Endosaccharibacter trunci TaxID=2812733 RepID=A0ABT1W415_9PROT|nr:hypothetical protein [Acetobacteraceae bacterium KSS8]
MMIQVQHREHVTERTYDDVVEAFYAATENAEAGIKELVAGSDTQAEFIAEFARRAGPRSRRLADAVLRLPLSSAVGDHRQSFGRDNNVRARPAGRAERSDTYLHKERRRRPNHGLLRPSSTLMDDLSPETAAAAAKLDAKLIELAIHISGVDAAA